MTATRPPTTPQFSRRIAVETPEHVVLEFELAGMGSRTAAALLDTLLIGAIITVLSLVLDAVGALGGVAGGLAVAILIALSFAAVWGYFVAFETFGGRTPGKRRLGLRVVMETGHPVTFQAAAVRNLIRIVDIQPAGASLVGLSFVFFHRYNKRLGDIVADTIVVRDRPHETTVPAPRQAGPAVIAAALPSLDDDEFRLLEQVATRLDTLPYDVRRRFTTELARRFSDRVPDRDPQNEVFLVRLYDSELQKRGAPGAHAATSGKPASQMAHRFVAQRQGAWNEFRRQATSIQRRGVASLSGAELTAFAAVYREVAGDLARARTYGVDSRVLELLERIVSLGHNVLYGARGVPRVRISAVLLKDLPAAVMAGHAYVLAAAVLFTAPGSVGYAVLRERPEMADQLIPATMIARAEAGARQQREGRGYAQAPSPYLPVLASGIVANNVQVAFTAFAAGVTAGVGTVIVLAFNGLFFGAVLGLFQNYHLGGWLLTFVAGHGVLELTAIFIAGGAGLVIAHAILAPGDLRRRDALVLRGRLAIRMVGAATTLLVLAGVIEGFLSASDAPAALKLGVSGLTGVLLVLYLAAGRRALSRDAVRPWVARSHYPGTPHRAG